MNAAMPELRSAVMIVVETSWEDAAGKAHVAQARMEDKSVGGACLRFKAPVEVGTRLRVQWRFEQFSGVVKYCRADGVEFVVGMQRDRGVPVAAIGGKPAVVAETASDRTERILAVKTESSAEHAIQPQGNDGAEIGAEKNTVIEIAAEAQSAEIKEQIPASDERPAALEEPTEEPTEEPKKEMQMPLMVKERKSKEPEREANKRHEAKKERKPMKRKWLDLTPWNNKQEGPSVRGNGNEGGGGRGDGPTEATEFRGNASAQNKMADSGEGGFAADLMGMEDVYLAAGVMQPRGRGVNKVIEMLRSPHMRGMAEEMKRSAVLMALEAAGITVYQIQRDAKARQDALDAYEAEQKKQAEAHWARKAEENAKIQADMERAQAQYMARIARNLEEVAQEQGVLRNWQALKQQELQKIIEAVDICVKPSKEASPTPAAPAPAPEKALAAAAGAESVGGITSS